MSDRALDSDRYDAWKLASDDTRRSKHSTPRGEQAAYEDFNARVLADLQARDAAKARGDFYPR